MSKKERTEREFRVVTYIEDSVVRTAKRGVPAVAIPSIYLPLNHIVRATNLDEARDIALRLRKEMEKEKRE